MITANPGTRGPLSDSADKAIAKLQSEPHHAELTIDREGAEAEVSAPVGKGWQVIAWAQRQWSGYWNGGAKIGKDF